MDFYERLALSLACVRQIHLRGSHRTANASNRW
jgi:hypothetical protein